MTPPDEKPSQRFKADAWIERLVPWLLGLLLLGLLAAFALTILAVLGVFSG